MALACDYVFQVMGLHRVEICVRPENTKSLRVVEKLGLAEEGMRPAYLHIDGQWRDHRVFRLLADDYPDGVLRNYLVTHLLPGAAVGRTKAEPHRCDSFPDTPGVIPATRRSIPVAYRLCKPSKLSSSLSFS